jgi:hypothetical protein
VGLKRIDGDGALVVLGSLSRRKHPSVELKPGIVRIVK